MASPRSLLAVLPLVGSCSPASPPGSASSPDVHAPPSPSAVAPGAVRYAARLSPRLGRWTLHAPPAARAYDYSASPITWTTCPLGNDCLPPSGQVALYTDQSLVSYVDANSICYGDGCATLAARPACQTPGVFCAPLQITSNTSFLLHDVVVQIANASGQSNQIDGCQPDATVLTGLCAEDATTTLRVDAPTSNLVSPILGNSSLGDLPCSFCLGNAAAADLAGLPGLVHVVVPGQTSPQHEAQVAFAVLRLASENDFDVELIVSTAAPVVDAITVENGAVAAAACATSGVTTLTIDGHGFGGPADCLDTGNGACSSSGAAPTGYGLSGLGAGSTAAAEIRGWSGTQVVAFLPTGALPPAAPAALSLDTAAAGVDEVPVSTCGCADLPVACPGTCSEATGEAVCTCTVTGFLNSQAAVNALAGCHVINGNLQILGAAVASLDALATVRQVTGTLSVGFSSVTSLNGLRHVASAGAVVLNINSSLGVASLPALASVGNVTVQNSPALTVVSLPRVTTVTNLRVLNNTTLTTLHAPSLATVTSLLDIRGNTALTSLLVPLLATVTTMTVHTNAGLCQSTVDALDAAASPAVCGDGTSVCTPNNSGC